MEKNIKETIEILRFALKAGSLVTETRGELLDWNKRMMSAALEPYGLVFPDDWESLSDDEKEKRLSKAMMVVEEMYD